MDPAIEAASVAFAHHFAEAGFFHGLVIAFLGRIAFAELLGCNVLLGEGILNAFGWADVGRKFGLSRRKNENEAESQKEQGLEESFHNRRRLRG